MQKSEIKYGVYGGLVVCAFKAVEFLPVFQKTRIENGIDTGLLALVVVAGFVIWGIKQKRKTSNRSSMTFLQAFTAGITITLFIAIITIPSIYVYGKFINSSEADNMIDYLKVNSSDGNVPSPAEVYEYYAPRNRSMKTGMNILLTGFVVSLFSAGMFRRVPVTQDDFVKDAELPSIVRKFFLASVFFTILPYIVYGLWALKWANINTLLFDFLTEPISNPLGLQEGTAFMSLIAFILNIVSYNKIAYYGHRLNIWNMRMVLVSIASLLISVWLIVN